MLVYSLQTAMTLKMRKPRSLEMPTTFGLSLQTGMRLETRNPFSLLLEN